MDLDIFNINKNDSKVLRMIKTEAKYILENFKGPEEYRENSYVYFSTLCYFLETGAKTETDGDIEYLELTELIFNHIKEGMPITKISITENDFIKDDKNITLIHKRCKNLKWRSNININNEKTVFYENAYKLDVKKVFDLKEHKTFETDEILQQQPIYISKGGIITGEFIDICFIKASEYVDHSDFSIMYPIKIPVSEVYFIDKYGYDQSIFVVDHREPALKNLQTVYNCSLLFDKAMKENKINLRNWKNGNKFDIYKLAEIIEPKDFEYNGVKSKCINETWYLTKNDKTLAKYKDNVVTIYNKNIRYQRIPLNIWKMFTGKPLSILKLMYNHNNPHIIIDKS